jgi:hypothetical protein
MSTNFFLLKQYGHQKTQKYDCDIKSAVKIEEEKNFTQKL